MAKQRPDWIFCGLVALVVAVTLWLLSLPLCPFVQQAALRRFHLQTRSFAVWALQAPIPAMYSFHNRYRLESQPWDATFFDRPVTGSINHFPVRIYTFAETRPLLLPQTDRQMLTIESRYRGRSLTTRWTVTEAEEGGYQLADEELSE